jgi:hypothetical protein
MMRFLAAAVAWSVVCAVFLPRTAAALPRPEILTGVGGTVAAAGEPNRGGLSCNLAALWPVEAGLRFGVTLYADDMGEDVGTLRDPHDGTVLGPVQDRHRWVYGGGWRGDYVFGTTGAWDRYASATWGYYRVEDDRLGEVQRAVSSAGFGLGLGLRHPFSPRNPVGASIRYHRLFQGGVGHYVTVSLDLSRSGRR